MLKKLKMKLQASMPAKMRILEMKQKRMVMYLVRDAKNQPKVTIILYETLYDVILKAVCVLGSARLTMPCLPCPDIQAWFFRRIDPTFVFDAGQ
jgi:hypothetical protein